MHVVGQAKEFKFESKFLALQGCCPAAKSFLAKSPATVSEPELPLPPCPARVTAPHLFNSSLAYKLEVASCQGRSAAVCIH